MRFLFMVFGIVLVVGLVAEEVSAQDTPEQVFEGMGLKSGQMISIRAPEWSNKQIKAWYKRVQGDTLYANTVGSRKIRAYPLNKIDELMVRRVDESRPPRPGRSARVGALIGGTVLGAFFAAAVHATVQCEIHAPDESCSKKPAVTGAVIGAVLGGGVGGLMGYLVGSKKNYLWEEAELQRPGFSMGVIINNPQNPLLAVRFSF